LWALLKRQNCLSIIDVGDIATKVKSLFDLENSALGNWGVRRGARGTIPGEPNHYGGRHNNSPGAESLWGAPSVWGCDSDIAK